MIAIDFQGGAHGNFLEFVCNVMAGVATDDHPFNSAGAAHKKTYHTPKVFYADHFSFDKILMPYDRVVSVTIDVDDLLPLSQVSLLRAGDYGYDNNELEIDTYNKLNNTHYRWVLDNIINSFFVNQIEDSYNAVKDPSWPLVTSLADFKNLPEPIKKECADIHKLKLLEFNKQHPNCPRHILREFFQIGFEIPENHGFITQQHKMQYNNWVSTYIFPFSAFYDTHKFQNQLKSIASWANINYTNTTKLQDLHTTFLTKQPYKDSKIKCDLVVQQLIDKKTQPPELNLIEEAYVNCMLNRVGHERRY